MPKTLRGPYRSDKHRKSIGIIMDDCLSILVIFNRIMDIICLKAPENYSDSCSVLEFLDLRMGRPKLLISMIY